MVSCASMYGYCNSNIIELHAVLGIPTYRDSSEEEYEPELVSSTNNNNSNNHTIDSEVPLWKKYDPQGNLPFCY